MLTPEPAGLVEPGHGWVSAHVFTAHPLDLVVRQLLPAALDQLRQRQLMDGYFFIRHWQFGPHLRLRVRLAKPDAEPQVRELLAAHAAEFFQTRRPSTPMTDRQYTGIASRLSALEPGSEVGSLARNDSLAFIPYLPEQLKYGRGAALRAVEDCFSTCSALAVHAVLTDWTPAQRLAHCFALFAGTLGPGADPRARPAPPHAAVEQYLRARATLLPVARAARAAARGEPALDGPDPAGRWFSDYRRARDLAAEPQRLADHLTHLACNRLGVRLDQEGTLRGLAALAVRESAEEPDQDAAGSDGAAGSDRAVGSDRPAGRDDREATTEKNEDLPWHRHR